MYGVVHLIDRVPLERPERAGVASSEKEEEQAVEQRQGEADEEHEAEERPPHQEGVRASLCDGSVWV